MFIDLTVDIEEGMPVFPGDPQPKISKMVGDYTIHTLFLTTHTGTHVDVPSHFIQGGKTLDCYEVSRFVGNALVINYGKIPERSKHLDFLLIYTGTSKKWRKGWEIKDYAQISLKEAEEIVSQGYKLVGIDSPSIGSFDVHKYLLMNDVLIVENLSSELEKIVGKVVKFICLPMKIRGVDGSPVRAVAEL